MHFRIFIDAATLKQVAIVESCTQKTKFPHLYRCGHIEADELCAILNHLVGISASL